MSYGWSGVSGAPEAEAAASHSPAPGEQVGRVERHLHRLGQRSGGPLRGEPGQFHLELGILGESVGEKDGVPDRHAFPVGNPPGPPHRPHDRDYGLGPERHP